MAGLPVFVVSHSSIIIIPYVHHDSGHKQFPDLECHARCKKWTFGNILELLVQCVHNSDEVFHIGWFVSGAARAFICLAWV